MTELSDKIRSRGYWQVQLRPTVFDAFRIGTLKELEHAVERAHVELRGWDYPHIGREVTKHQDFIQGKVEFDMHNEVWRLYQSAQFVHLFSMTEDWMEHYTVGWEGRVKPGELLEVTSTLWTLTEMFLFSARLVEALNVSSDVTLTYKLVGLAGRRLQTLDTNRIPFASHKMAAKDLHEYQGVVTLPVPKLIGSARELAVDHAFKLYERFNWEPSRQAVVDDQRKLLERRFA